MKRLLPGQGHYGCTALTLLCVIQLTAYRAGAQQEQTLNVNDNAVYSNSNVTGNQSLNNREVNTPFPTGPNGPGFVRGININVPATHGFGPNAGGPNLRGFTSSVIPKQAVSSRPANKPKTSRPATVQAAAPNPQRRKPKPKATGTAPARNVARPAAPVASAPAIAAPVLAEQVQASVSNPLVVAANRFAVVEQVMNNDNNLVSSQVLSNVSAPALSIANAPAVRSNAVSGSSASSARSHRSGRKKHGSVYYSTSKKMKKLFARTKSQKFDPAKCFVWK